MFSRLIPDRLYCERNKVRAAYNHAEYLPERRKMMKWWADYLDDVAKKKQTNRPVK